MASLSSDIALLLFTRTPAEEVRQKTICPGLPLRAAAAVFGRLIRHTRAIGRGSGLPCFVVTSAEQVGGSFGERFYHALSSVFARGFRSVIAVGNDCPQLTAQDLLTASDLLRQGQAVLGPATDGGVYLLGLTREQLPPQQAFEAVGWHSAQVQAEVEHLLQEVNGYQIALLRPLADVDGAADLQKAFNQKQLQPALYRYLQSLLASFCPGWVREPKGRAASSYLSLAYSFRGPPLFPSPSFC